ncbi:MAG: hypothetical protein VX278_18750, partial [Myxococcota bacterium]|nr:hypothetical protein [Myxococcota bacterium]
DFANGKEGEKPRMNQWRKAICEATGLKDGIEVISRVSSDFDDMEETQKARDGIPTLRTNPNKIIKEMRDNGLKVILCSPWNQVAFSYEEEPFDATINIYLGNYTHAEDIEQGFRRWRRTEEHYFLISSRKSYFGKNDIKETFGEIISSYPRSREEKARIEIHSNLTNSYFMRTENPYCHFHIHMDAKQKVIEKLKPSWGLAKYQRLLKQAEEDAEEEWFEIHKNASENLKKFYLFGDCVLERVSIEDISSITREDLKRISSFKQEHCRALCQRFLWDESQAMDMNRMEEEKFYFLHWELWKASIDVLRPYIDGKENHLFDWLISPSRELSFHYDNTDESNNLKRFVKANSSQLKNSLKSQWLSRMNKKWYETPSLLFEHIAFLLFLDFEKTERNSKYTIPEITKEMVKEYGITYRGRSKQAKEEILARYRQRKRSGKKLSLNEKRYESTLGPIYTFKKRKYAPLQVVEALEDHLEKRRFEEGEEENISHKDSSL